MELRSEDFKPRTESQNRRRMTVLALRAADTFGTTDPTELREAIKDFCARDVPPVPYDGRSIDSALKRALGVRGEAFKL